MKPSRMNLLFFWAVGLLVFLLHDNGTAAFQVAVPFIKCSDNLGCLGKRRRHVPSFSMIADPLLSVSDIASGLAGMYQHQLEINEYRTDVLTSMSIYTISNIISQLSDPNSKNDVVDGDSQPPNAGQSTVGLNFRLVLSYSFIGFLDGSWGYHWYPIVESIFPGTSLATVVEKMAADSAIYGPTFTFLYLFLLTVLEKGISASSVQAGLRRVRSDFRPVLLGGQAFWAPANALNYALVPVEYRVFGACTGLLIYTLGLSFYELEQRKKKEEEIIIQQADEETLLHQPSEKKITTFLQPIIPPSRSTATITEEKSGGVSLLTTSSLDDDEDRGTSLEEVIDSRGAMEVDSTNKVEGSIIIAASATSSSSRAEEGTTILR